ncbi:TIGR03013 family PEP-CTERM/XrtA system glycosyltransferase [Geobacter chapellei]|uniref:TIGR03013 family PEP-CTERM/XrtA system glycosyltransferase n=2 Tax=Pelotalea chapellei TaxID=44671 RepID=A0ABS5U5G5_9BACT|nr:TIGR03013 family PEP-CTERM/XrtA system glycosyltransferase [Pelotalea chapellei]
MIHKLALFIFSDLLLAFLAFYSAGLIRLGIAEVLLELHTLHGLLNASIFAVVAVFASQFMDVYDIGKNTRKSEIIVNILLGSFTSFFLLSMIYYLNPSVMLGRGILAISIALFALFQFLWHVIYLECRHHPRFSERIIILGTGALAQQMGQLAASRGNFYCVAGYASCSGDNDHVREGDEGFSPLPPEAIVSTSEDLLASAIAGRADLIVVALSERRGIFPLRDVLRCKLNGIEIMDAPSFYERVTGSLMLEQITPSWIIFSSGFRRTSLLALFKRLSDIVLSIIGLLLTASFLPFIALAIKLDSRGPLFFSQVRVGNREKLFRLYKFRTMGQDAEKASGAVWAEKNDPRVTRVGAFLRDTRIDEIPQLFNVLKGDMSFIGPRPERPEFVENLKKLIPYYSKRHFIKPGVTGWAQVRYPYGASVHDAVEKLRYDLYYIKHYSVVLDLLIFFETIKVVVFGKGAR